MKILVLNDRQSSHRYYVNTLAWETSVLLQPQESRVIEIVAAPAGSVPFLKDWGGYTLISYVEETYVPENTSVHRVGP